MRIAAHHLAGTPEHRFSKLIGTEVEYAPHCAWPDDCMVQWGHGIVPAVPFFEAFPPGTFIRGEGGSIAEAEDDAFAQYESEFLCEHVWGRHHARRGTYLNGAAWCRKCDAFRGQMFKPVVVLGHMRKPLNPMEADYLRSLENDHELSAIMDRKYPDDASDRKRRARVLRIRLNLFGAKSWDDTASPTPEITPEVGS